MYFKSNWLRLNCLKFNRTGTLNILIFIFCVTVSMLSADTALADTYVSGRISSDTTWTLAGSPYIVTGTINVYQSSSAVATLTIEPGVTVKFDTGTGINIGHITTSYRGALDAQGTATDPISFTSSAQNPQPGDWRGIAFYYETDDIATRLDHCIVEYGGHTTNANLYFDRASPSVINSIIRYSSANGVYISKASPTIGDVGSGNTISDNGSNGIETYDKSSQPKIVDNELSNNSSYAMYIHPEFDTVAGNNGIGNGVDAVGLQAGRIDQDITWRKNDLPYCVVGDIGVYKTSYTTATLTIEPGVIVKFSAGKGLTIAHLTTSYKGALNAQGTAEAPIVFTSMAASPQPGDWKGIAFYYTTDATATILDHCIVEYGGLTNNSNLYFDRTSPTVINSTIRYSSTNGIYISKASPVIGETDAGNTISNNGANGIETYDKSSHPKIVDNVFSENASYTMLIYPETVEVTGNAGQGNGVDAIGVQPGTIDQDISWAQNSMPYCVTGDVYVLNTRGLKPILTVKPGVTVRFEEGTGLTIGYGMSWYWGALDARGTAEEPIKFTSMKTVPQPGDWKGITFNYATIYENTILEHCIIEYGGHTNNANLYYNYAGPNIINSTIQKSGGYGIRCYQSKPGSIKFSHVENNMTGIYLYTSTPPEIEYNWIENNQNYGIENGKSNVNVNAQNTWWGDASGPRPTGSGDLISQNVLFSPWAISSNDFDGDNVLDAFEYALFGNLHTIDAPPDNDNDGMNDDWEYQYGLNYNLNDAYDDFDGDGYLNYVEYRTSHDPSNATDSPDFSVFYDYDDMGRVKNVFKFH